MKEKTRSIIYDVLIIFSSVLGIYLTITNGNFMGSRGFLYYTIQSNALIAIISSIFLYFKLKNKKISNSLYLIKYVFTVGISLTLLVFSFVLAPQMLGEYNDYLFSVGNLTVHFISPILAILSFIFFDKIKLKSHTYLYGFILPLFYFLFVLALTSFSSKALFMDLKGVYSRFPYLFMDFETNGWFRTNGSIWHLGFFYWLIILFSLIIITSKLLIFLNTKRAKK